LATNRSWRTETGEEKEEVCYVNVVVWGKQAEAAGKYLKKGRPVFIEGRLQFESWEKNGEKRTSLKVHCERLQFLGSAGGGGKDSEGGGEPAEAAAPASSSKGKSHGEPDLENDDIPF
jgi:single-strand DNA-binding protein